MIIFLNGSFGVGKTTVATLLQAALPGSKIYDPELAGSILMRLPKWIALRGGGTDDFQDIDLWRRSVVAGTKLCRLVASGPVIIPMTFSRRDYFDESMQGMTSVDPHLHVFCLRARVETITQRLVERGTAVEGPRSEWIIRQIHACAVAHRDPHFGEPIATDDRSAADVAADILSSVAPGA